MLGWLGRHKPKGFRLFYLQAPAAGARATIEAVDTDLPSGTYLAPRFNQWGAPKHVVPQHKARDPYVASRLWDLSAELTGCDWVGSRKGSTRDQDHATPNVGSHRQGRDHGHASGTLAVRPWWLPFGMVLGRTPTGSLRRTGFPRSGAEFTWPWWQLVRQVASALFDGGLRGGRRCRGPHLGRTAGSDRPLDGWLHRAALSGEPPQPGRCAHGVDTAEGSIRGVGPGNAPSSLEIITLQCCWARGHLPTTSYPRTPVQRQHTAEGCRCVRAPESSQRAGARSGSMRWSGCPSRRKCPHRCSSWAERMTERSPMTTCVRQLALIGPKRSCSRAWVTT